MLIRTETKMFMTMAVDLAAPLPHSWDPFLMTAALVGCFGMMAIGVFIYFRNKNR